LRRFLVLLCLKVKRFRTGYNAHLMTLWTRFTAELRAAIAASTEEAGRRGCDEVAVEHLLIAICKNAKSAMSYMVERVGIDRRQLLKTLNETAPVSDQQRQRAARLSSKTLHLLDVATAESDRLENRRVSTQHVAIALSVIDTGALLRELGLTKEAALAAEIDWQNNGFVVWQDRKNFVRRGFDKLPAPIRKVTSLPSLAWKVYVGKSLGHPRSESTRRFAGIRSRRFGWSPGMLMLQC
jgi:hypothetical protein